THDEGTCDSLSFSGGFLRNGHWEVLNWESGTTEAGSSGSALFAQNKRVFGTLSGGAASCKTIGYDAFARLDKMWSYRKESSQQLAFWLNPTQQNTKVLDGFDPYHDEQLKCTLISNYMTEDVLDNTSELQILSKATEYADRFDQLDETTLAGVSIGIHKYYIHSQSPAMTIRIYSGDTLPEYLEKIYRFSMIGLTAGAMNYFTFDDPVSVRNNFFVTVSSNDPLDSLVFYRSGFRGVVGSSSMLIRNNSGWQYASDFQSENQGASMLMQVNVCGSSFKQEVDSLNDPGQLMKFYPNPARQYLVVEFLKREQFNELSLSNMLGQKVYQELFASRSYAEIDLSDFVPGIYLLNIQSNGQSETKRVLIY
ncbi:MAG: T9SS type A sorting domain-containing protein, partial [Prolixibacteraceae bacterium]|nr:T9SS type A sorting domain-containing protein [Prolixibacteraceae bacterium]